MRLKMRWNENEVSIKKSVSPNSLYFYLKKFDNDLKLAEEGLKLFRDTHGGKLKRKCQAEYWIWKGFDEETSKKMAFDWNSEHGKKASKKRVKSPYLSEINNLMKNKGMTEVEAKLFAGKRRRSCSPRLEEYWTQRGYDIDLAKRMVTEFQSKNSPRTTHYWINKGLSYEDAVVEVSKYQDNISIDAIEKRVNCTREEALDIQKEYIAKHKNSCNSIEDEYYGLYLMYKRKVEKISNATYRVYQPEIDPDKKRSKKHHLDHIVSVRDGFLNEIPAEIISCKYNLSVITENENCSKQSKSGQTIENLIRLYNEDKSKL